MSLRGIDKAARLCLYGSHHTLAISSAGSAKMNVSFAFVASAFGSQRPVLRIRASYSSNATNQPINYPNQQQQQQQPAPPPPMSHQAPPQPTYQQQAPLPTYQQQRPPMNPQQNQYQQAPMPQQQQINQYQQPPINQQQQQPPINQQQQQQQQQPPLNQQQQQPPINQQQQQQPPMNRPPMSQQQRPQMQRQPQQFQSTRTRMNRPPPMPRPPQNLPPWEEGEMRSIFDRWAARCQKNYLNAEEREYRYNTFKSRFFKPHQNTQDHRESLERLNDFGDYTVDELYDIIGGKRKACEIRPHDYKG